MFRRQVGALCKVGSFLRNFHIYDFRLCFSVHQCERMTRSKKTVREVDESQQMGHAVQCEEVA
jgi:hypothetical protein